jgi:hypothetical protein
MKKNLTFGVLMIMFIWVSAQERSFNFGLHGTPSLSWMKSNVDGEVYKSDGATIHMGYGAEFNYFFVSNLGIGTGIDIVYTGGKMQFHTAMPINNVIDTGIISRKYKLQYLKIPLVIIGSTGNMLGKFAIYAKFGVGNSFKLSAKSTDKLVKDNSQDAAIEVSNNIEKNVSFFNESMIIGVGFTYKLAKIISINLGLTYNNGFTDVLKSTNGLNSGIKENAKVNSFDLSLGLLF